MRETVNWKVEALDMQNDKTSIGGNWKEEKHINGLGETAWQMWLTVILGSQTFVQTLLKTLLALFEWG